MRTVAVKQHDIATLEGTEAFGGAFRIWINCPGAMRGDMEPPSTRIGTVEHDGSAIASCAASSDTVNVRTKSARGSRFMGSPFSTS